MIVILYNIRSLYNVGSVFRTADAVGVEKIYLCGITPKPIDEFGRFRRQLAKVSLGAEKYVKWEYVKSAARLIDKLKNPPAGKGYKIFSIEQSKKSTSYYKIHYHKKRSSSMIVKKNKKEKNKKIALVLGNEVKGLPKSILNKSDKILEIPMKGKKESLNVAVAFGIIAFHIINS